MTRIAILDDYQNTARECADWDSIPGDPSIVAFHEHLPGEDAVAEALTHTVWRDATIAIGITDHAVATGELAARSIVDPTKVSGDDQIKAGLHLLELEAALGRELDEATLSGLGIPPAADNAPAPTGNKKPEQNAEEDPYAKWMRLIGEGPASAAEMRVHGLEHGFLEVKPESNEGDSNDG